MSTSTDASYPLPTADNPEVCEIPEDNKQEIDELSEMNKSIDSMAGTLQSIGTITENALKNVTGMIVNIASYNSVEKEDYDEDGNLIVDGNGLYKKRYRSTENISENSDIASAISEQEKALKDAREAEQNMKIEVLTSDDILRVLEETRDALDERIFGPMWKNWTTAEDFLEGIRMTLQSILDTFDPLMDLVDQLQDYVNSSVNTDSGIKVKTSNSGQDIKLPLGVMALEALNIIIDYIRQLIQNFETLAEEYTVEELNVLLRKGTSGSNWGTVMKSIQDLIQLIVDCMKPYIHNLVMALILDAIDMIVDKLDKAGILSPSGPLKLIPIAITLVRSILSGNLEAIEEMVKQTITKLINMIQLAMIAMKDPSILWADTERMDKEIAVARYKELAEDEDGFTAADKDKFLYHTDTSYTAGARHFLQKMKGENKETFNQIVNFASTYTDLGGLYKNAISAKNEKEKNKKVSKTKAQKLANDMKALSKNMKKRAKEPKI